MPMCPDGGKCHHACGARCLREVAGFAPLGGTSWDQHRRLYGLPGAEYLRLSLSEACEEAYDASVDEVEEWSVKPASAHLPDPIAMLDWIAENVADWGEVNEEWTEDLHVVLTSSAIQQQAADLMAAIASKVTYRMADALLATHTVTWPDDGRTLVNGKPVDEVLPTPLPERAGTEVQR